MRILNLITNLQYYHIRCDKLERYRAVLRVMGGKNKALILDVGGQHGELAALLRAHGNSVVSTDIVPLAQWEGSLFICSDGIHLPFRDSIFDYVISCDVLEHLSPTQRSRFVLELVRVAHREVILTFYTRHTFGLRTLLRVYRLFGKPPPDWHLEHKRFPLPSVHELLELASQTGVKIRLIQPFFGTMAWLFTALIDCISFRGLRSAVNLIGNVILALWLDFPSYSNRVVAIEVYPWRNTLPK